MNFETSIGCDYGFVGCFYIIAGTGVDGVLWQSEDMAIIIFSCVFPDLLHIALLLHCIVKG